ncbi:MAG: hypothetical protein KTR28_03515 [Micavibrio sp.]|nr:hypothetical protein [Micavibrio sp.]
MVSAPAAIAAEQAMIRQNVAFSVVKASAEAEQAIVNILDQAARSAPVSGSLGSNVNISA